MTALVWQIAQRNIDDELMIPKSKAKFSENDYLWFVSVWVHL